MNYIEVIGRKFTDSNTGISHLLGPRHGEGFLTSRDWSVEIDEKLLESPSKSSLIDNRPVMSEERELKGLQNIKDNASVASVSEGIIELLPSLPIEGCVYLVGAGPSLRYHSASAIASLQELGCVIATNKAVGYLPDRFYDYAWISDPVSDCFCKEEWFRFATGDLITHFSTPNEVINQFGNVYFFGLGLGSVPSWSAAIKAEGLNKYEYGILDAGLCALYSQLHMCYLSKKAGATLEKVVLIGHDFALTDNRKYFDRPFNYEAEKADLNTNPDLFFEIAEDIHGNLIITQPYLYRQAQLVDLALRQLRDIGVKIVNATGGGILQSEALEVLDYCY